MGLFNITKQTIPTAEEQYGKMFGTNDDDAKDKIIEVDITLLDDIKDQPFAFRKEKAEQLVDSVKQVGVLEPILCRHKKNGRYDIIAGRHRKAAAELAGLKTVPVIVKDVSVDVAKFILLSTNTDRNNDYSYSELAFAYKEQMELLEKLGSNSVTSQIAEKHNTNRKQIYRYIRLTYLSKQLLKLVDNGQIPFTVAVDLSYFSPENQNEIFRYLLNHNEKVTIKQGKKLKDFSNDGSTLTQDVLQSIFNNELILDEPLEKKIQQSVDTDADSQNQGSNNSIDEKPIKGQNLLSQDICCEIILSIYNQKDICEYYVFNMPTQNKAMRHLATIPIIVKYKDMKIRNAVKGLLVTANNGEECLLSYQKIDLEIRQMLCDNLFDKATFAKVLSDKISTINN
ncbi:ParB/RepB/Spo0J family partition protein [Oscillospiraceae bacterium LCP25S3_E3]